MEPSHDRCRGPRGHGFHGAQPEVMGSDAGTHRLILRSAESIASERRVAGGAW